MSAQLSTFCRQLYQFLRQVSLAQMKSQIFAGIFSIVLLLLVGCGGSGNGGGSNTISYRTNWNSTSGSQIVQITNLSTSAMSTRLIKSTDVDEIGDFGGLENGRYLVKVTLHSDMTGSSPSLGEITAIIQPTGTESFTSEVGGVNTDIVITPGVSIIPQGTTQQYAAHLVGASGKAHFASPGQLTFSANGNVTVDASTKIALAGSPGSGNLVVNYGPDSLTKTLPITVTATGTTTSEWTILVYMNAANDLYPYSTLNMNQIEEVAGNPNVRFVVQWKQSQSNFPSSTFNGTRRYLAKPDVTNNIASQLVQNMGTSVDMGLPSTLADFISWGKANYPANRYGLIVWNHGNGWQRSANSTRAVSYDDQTGNAIQIYQLDSALGSNHFDFLAWDSSLMQMLEVAYEVRSNADYVIGSEESPPGEGYPYDDVFRPFRDNATASTRNLSKSFVDGMVNDPRYTSRKITQSVIESSKLPALANSVSELAVTLINRRNLILSTLADIRANAKSFSQTGVRKYYDLGDICTRLKNAPGMPSDVADAATQVLADLDNAVVWEGHNAQSLGSTGLAIDYSTGGLFTSLQTDYNPLKLAIDTYWDEWLRVSP